LLSSKTTAKKLKATQAAKTTAAACRLTDVACRYYEAEHFALTFQDKEIRSLKKAAAKKSIKTNNKDEIARISKDNKAVLGAWAKTKTIKVMVKQVTDGTKLLEVEKKKGMHTTELLNGARLDFVEADHERDKSKKLAKVAVTAKIDSQLEVKLQHTKHIEQIKWDTEIQKMEKQQAAKNAASKKTADAFAMKAQLMKYQASHRSDEKKKDAPREEKKRRGDIGVQARRMEIARTVMNNTGRGNGGAFLHPARCSIHDVSNLCCFFICLSNTIVLTSADKCFDGLLT
jgi:hypothetical protein